MANWRMNGVDVRDEGVFTKIKCEVCGFETVCRYAFYWPQKCGGCGKRMNGVKPRKKRDTT